MATIAIESSSEEDDDIYLNSVAKLRALKKQTSGSVIHNVVESVTDDVAENEIKENTETRKRTGPVTRRRTARGRNQGRKSNRSSRQEQNTTATNHDSDLEIVSVEEPRNASLDDSDWITVGDKIEKEADPKLEDDDNYDMNIKVLWRSKNVHRLNIQRNEGFRKVFQYFADLEGVAIDDILITKKEKTIKRTDTPASMKLSVIDILEGGVLKRTGNGEGTSDNEDTCVIKVQTTGKKTLTVKVRKDEDFGIVFEKCAQELDLDPSKMKLYFDGEVINTRDTPDSLDIEDEACFDLRVSS